MKWKIWLDDIREAPYDYLWCHSVNECKKQIELCEKLDGVELLDLDHDLGDYASDGDDGIALIDWLVERDTVYPIALHTKNPVGYTNMRRAIEAYYRRKQERATKTENVGIINDNATEQVYYNGIFWIVDQEILDNNISFVFRIPVDSYGNLLDIDLFYPLNSKDGKGYNHELTWKTYVSQKYRSGKEYNYYPRGRVEIRNNTARIFISPSLDNPKILKFIEETFAVADLNVKIIVDGSDHYKSLENN